MPHGHGMAQTANPLAELGGSMRTQLWKPSRSWWEAKSGKNPWIEPASHNRRWRYLWAPGKLLGLVCCSVVLVWFGLVWCGVVWCGLPLRFRVVCFILLTPPLFPSPPHLPPPHLLPQIHYHKFLAKCIKKLKRNGVDVKASPSPLAAFLRTEVCAISDHLAQCSYFTSEMWMGCLGQFRGWTVAGEEAEAELRALVLRQDLRAAPAPRRRRRPLRPGPYAAASGRSERGWGDRCGRRSRRQGADRRQAPEGRWPRRGRT